MDKKEFITDIDYNNSSEACPTCALECEKINEKINKRKLSELKNKEVSHILSVFEDKK